MPTAATVPLLSMEERMAEFLPKRKQVQPVSLDPAERISVTRYLESLERDEEERSAREGTTAAMLAFASASDMREVHTTCYDAHEAEQAGFHFAADCPAHDPVLAQD